MKTLGNEGYIKIDCQNDHYNYVHNGTLAFWSIFANFSSIFMGDRQGYYSFLNTQSYVNWSKCPTGDYNQCKGKEVYPLVCSEVIAGYDQQVLGVSSVHFGLAMVNTL